MQSIQRDTEEVLQRLEELKGSPTNDGELDRCIDTLNNIWRTANDYEAAIPTITTSRTKAQN